jgi:hypothetical protein
MREVMKLVKKEKTAVTWKESIVAVRDFECEMDMWEFESNADAQGGAE